MDDPKYQDGEPQSPADFDDSNLIISSDTRRAMRIPPGQSRTRKWPVLDAFGTPRFDAQKWQLRVFGLVENERTFNLEEFNKLPRVRVFSDFHCVTKWSRLGNIWEGVATRYLLEQVGILPKARYVILHAYDNGWSTNLPLDEFLSEDALLADRHDGEPIDADHGGPVRGMVPKLYAWKSAKWITGIELSQSDQPGYWERGGYHNLGDPWLEQRFGSS
ncbi:sulfite oxidase-like oxidoreductase [Mariniblastus sp.]|jgi:DMSO/TMAO reductase YedYZ molybdopterin-dependent catalytic subunit|nr:sulfite oxidase-like oxidoreductase [Mariniblastus sp.]MDB4757127.1 sulfite oxidase-like oxidoreductase [Mariniblastus sp.]